MANVYGFDPGEDDDLFDEPDHNHTIDGTVCPTCEIRHPNSSDETEETQEYLLNLLDNMPPALARTIIDKGPGGGDAPHAKTIVEFLRLSDTSDNQDSYSPAIRALGDVLDELTEGEYSRRLRLYSLERSLVSTHMALRSANSAYTESVSSEDADAMGTEPLRLLSIMTADRLESIKNAYSEFCEEIGKAPDRNLVEAGLIDTSREEKHQREELLHIMRGFTTGREDSK